MLAPSCTWPWRESLSFLKPGSLLWGNGLEAASTGDRSEGPAKLARQTGWAPPPGPTASSKCGWSSSQTPTQRHKLGPGSTPKSQPGTQEPQAPAPACKASHSGLASSARLQDPLSEAQPRPRRSGGRGPLFVPLTTSLPPQPGPPQAT